MNNDSHLIFEAYLKEDVTQKNSAVQVLDQLKQHIVNLEKNDPVEIVNGYGGSVAKLSLANYKNSILNCKSFSELESLLMGKYEMGSSISFTELLDELLNIQ